MRTAVAEGSAVRCPGSPLCEVQMLLFGLHCFSLFPTVWRSDPAVLQAYLSGTTAKTVCWERELQAPVHGTMRSSPAEGHEREWRHVATSLRTRAPPPRNTLHI